MLVGWQIEPLDVVEYPPGGGAPRITRTPASKPNLRRTVARDSWVLGEDSGLEVDGLGGRPGVQSARFAGTEHVTRLLAELAGVQDEGRRARYVCELVGLSPEGEERRGTGILEGRIAEEPRGLEGFGFDPIFVPAGETRTVAELGDSWKADNSHRARAAKAFAATGSSERP